MDVKKALTTAALTTCTSANYAAVKEPCRSCHSRSLIGFVPFRNGARQLEKNGSIASGNDTSIVL